MNFDVRELEVRYSKICYCAITNITLECYKYDMTGEIIHEYDGEDVILLGETHDESSHYELEEEAIYRSLPRYVLSEGLDDKDPEELEPLVDSGELTSLRDFQAYFEDNYEDSEFLGEDIDSLYDSIEEPDSDSILDKGEVPESVLQLLDMPFARMHDAVIEEIAESMSEREDFERAEYQKWTDEDYVKPQDSKIEEIDGARGIILDYRHSGSESLDSLVGPINDIRDEGFEIGLAGCDIDKNQEYSSEEEGHFDHIDTPEEKLKAMKEEPEKAAEDFARNLEKIQEMGDEQEIEKRDEAMSSRAEEFVAEKETERPVLAVIGANHLEGVAEKLRDSGVSVYTEDLNEAAPVEKDGYERMKYGHEIAESF